jgi:hypothetical protein
MSVVVSVSIFYRNLIILILGNEIEALGARCLSSIVDYKDAEELARKWVEEKYPKSKIIRFRRVWKEGDSWFIESEIKIWKGVLEKKEVRALKLKLNSETGLVMGYSEES